MEIRKSGMISIVGRPNVGKSTLTNALVGEKVAIVTNKPQTTRNRITAILNRGESQFVFVDTPGLHKARTRLGDYMVNVVKESVADVDAVMLLVEPSPTSAARRRSSSPASRPWAAPRCWSSTRWTPWSTRRSCWRSSSSIPSPRLHRRGAHLRQERRGSGRAAERAGGLPAPGPPALPRGMVSDQPERQMMAEFCGRSCSSVSIRRFPTHRRGDHQVFRAG